MLARLTLDDLVIIGIKGTVLALNAFTGAEVWRTHLKSSGFVNLTLDRQRVLAATAGELFCLDGATGRVIWNNPLKGMGYGIVSFANAPSAAAAAAEEHARDARSTSAADGTPATHSD